MKTTEKDVASLETLASVLVNIPNVWSATSVEAEPQKWLRGWQVYKAVKANIQPELFGYHIIGYDIQGGHGAVSSKIEQFDPVRMCGITRSGRIYQLVGLPGIDQDAHYTLNVWVSRNEVVIEDATEEFIQYYKIDFERVREISK